MEKDFELHEKESDSLDDVDEESEEEEEERHEKVSEWIENHLIRSLKGSYNSIVEGESHSAESLLEEDRMDFSLGLRVYQKFGNDTMVKQSLSQDHLITKCEDSRVDSKIQTTCETTTRLNAKNHHCIMDSAVADASEKTQAVKKVFDSTFTSTKSIVKEYPTIFKAFLLSSDVSADKFSLSLHSLSQISPTGTLLEDRDQKLSNFTLSIHTSMASNLNPNYLAQESPNGASVTVESSSFSNTKKKNSAKVRHYNRKSSWGSAVNRLINLGVKHINKGRSYRIRSVNSKRFLSTSSFPYALEWENL